MKAVFLKNDEEKFGGISKLAFGQNTSCNGVKCKLFMRKLSSLIAVKKKIN